MHKATALVLFGEQASFLLQVSAVALDVLHHQVFARQLIVIWKMVDDSKKIYVIRLEWGQMKCFKCKTNWSSERRNPDSTLNTLRTD